MTTVSAHITPFSFGDQNGVGDEATEIRDAHCKALLDFQRGRALPPFLTKLSPEARVAVDARWSDLCEAMFEFLAEHFPTDLTTLVSSDALAPSALTFAAEMVGRSGNSRAVRAALLPLLKHDSALVREGAIYGLRGHADAATVKKLRALAEHDASPAIRKAASDTLDDQ